MKRRLLLVFSPVALGLPLVACGAILGLQEPTIDDTLDTGTDTGTGSDSPTNTDGPVGDGGAGPTQLLNARVRRIAVDDASVYYTEQFDYIVGRVGRDGTGNVALANGSAVAGYFPNTITTDDTDVYWASVNGIHSCKKAGCGGTPTHIIDDSSSYGPGSIAVDATNVYFVNYDSNNNDANSIMKVPKGAANGTVTTLVAVAKLCTTVNRMVMSGAYLYYTCDEGPVGRVTISDGAVDVLTATSPPPPLNADTLSVGASSIFYSQFLEQGTVYQMPIVNDASSNAIAVTQPYPIAMASDPTYVYWATAGVALDNGSGAIVRCAASQCSSTTTTLTSKIDVPNDLVVDSEIFFCALGNGDTPNTGVWKMPKPP